ncbi:hypothetical protein E2C01_013831 [Portunus trituberculatus]|uniref:Uncharacterized protein n=1 Tax=Portunus trituberculatus TaxID=210409 RepID=A0A5B7DII5_PORTR|nr:hypothetical protein [Portunus trituberculatus]
MEILAPFSMGLSSVSYSWLVLAFMALLEEGNSVVEDSWDANVATVVKDVLLASLESNSSLIIIAENKVLIEAEIFNGAFRGVAVFEETTNGSQLSQTVMHAREVETETKLVRMASWMVVVVVVSDDPVFLAAFAQQAREGRLLVWATRLIVVSRQAPYSLHPLHQTLALTNSLLLLVDGAAGVARCVFHCMICCSL